MEQKATYESIGQLICDEHQHILSLSYLNDDYCDCQDGADEPGTSACSHIVPSTSRDSQEMFHCHNQGYYATKIPTAWVNDDVCDCCDGSDEYAPGSGNCTNTCHVSARETIESLNKQLQQIQAGLKVREEKAARAHEILREKQQQLEQLEQNRKVKEEERQNALEEKYHDYKDKRVVLMKTLGLMDFSSILELNEIILELIMAVDQCESNAENSVSRILSILLRHREYAHINQLSVIEHEEREFQRQRALPSSVSPDRDENEETDEEEMENDDMDDKKDSSPMRSLLSELSFLSYGMNTNDETHEEISSSLSKLDQEMQSIQAIIADTEGYGPDQMYLTLLNECVSTQAGQYKYEMCFYGNAKQDAVSLGKWDGFSADGKKVSFVGGQSCWNGPARSFHLELECGPEMKLYQIDEIEICVYTGKLILPLACDPHALEEIQQEIKRLAEATGNAGHDEL